MADWKDIFLLINLIEKKKTQFDSVSSFTYFDRNESEL